MCVRGKFYALASCASGFLKPLLSIVISFTLLLLHGEKKNRLMTLTEYNIMGRGGDDPYQPHVQVLVNV